MRLYNSLSRQTEEVKPTDGRTVQMYSCGPTVYRYAHLGNFRTFMLGDLIRRALRFEGQDVYWVMNITDVGHMTDDQMDRGRDKMDVAVEDEGLPPLEIAEKYTRAFLEDADALGIERADEYPKATDHTPEMLEIIQRLLERGCAYEVEGNVYFDVQSFPAYGALSGNTLDELRAGHRQDLEIDPNKRHHADFALWKKAGSGRLMKWESPWGDGFPGWHVECSAMSMKYLGERFDIHTGGNDLKFPHHEDEIAQSECATGHPVVTIWVHGGFLQMERRKMAKSAQNIKRVTELPEHGIDPLAFRLLCFESRYRSEMEFTWNALEGANSRLTRLRQWFAEWEEDGSVELSPQGEDVDRRFREAVADDLDMPRAMVVLNDAVSARSLPAADRRVLLASWDVVLGLDLGRIARGDWTPDEEVLQLLRRRDEARKARDFEKSDRIRAQLAEMGLEVMDTPEGTRVRPKNP
jgi:cysteinyl-tRNA synthetase